MKIIYKNPINNKREVLFTHCVMCGKLIFRRKENFGFNKLKSHKFYYCNNKNGEHDYIETENI